MIKLQTKTNKTIEIEGNQINYDGWFIDWNDVEYDDNSIFYYDDNNKISIEITSEGEVTLYDGDSSWIESQDQINKLDYNKLVEQIKSIS